MHYQWRYFVASFKNLFSGSRMTPEPRHKNTNQNSSSEIRSQSQQNCFDDHSLNENNFNIWNSFIFFFSPKYRLSLTNLFAFIFLNKYSWCIFLILQWHFQLKQLLFLYFNWSVFLFIFKLGSVFLIHLPTAFFSLFSFCNPLKYHQHGRLFRPKD